MARCVCIMMQKNEILLEPWLLYHGYLFGFENLYVYDNGSTHFSVIETLNRYEKLGVHVDLTHKSERDFCEKGEIMKRLIDSLAEESFDFFFPLDCDEFVIMSGENGFTSARNEIHSYLDSMIKYESILHVSHQLINLPGRLDLFALIDFSKSVIPNKPLYYLDHGFHSAQLHGDSVRISSQIYYAHFHNKPFGMLLESARQKLSPFVDCDDIEALRNYDSNGSHLIRYFFDFKEKYVEQYQKSARVIFPDVSDMLHALTVSNFIRLWQFDSPNQDRPEYEPNCIISGLYSRANYMDANKDVAQSPMDPLIHYVIFGYREGRPLRVQ